MASLLNMSGGSLLNKGLPYDAEIEYLESSGTQYIDTGIDATSVYGLEFKFMPTSNIMEWASILSGFLDNFTVGYVANVKNKVYIRCRGNEVMRPYISTSSYNTLLLSGSTLSLAGTSVSVTTPVATKSGNLMLANNSQLSRYAKVRFSTLRIYGSNNTLLRDFIPVRIGTTGYMYDKVSGQLFGNSGTGNFILGPDKLPLSGVIDMGLPSGTLWAQGNIIKDANGNYAIGEPTDYGCYFSWGNIDGHNEGEGYNFNSDNYALTPGSQLTGNIPSDDAEHDAAVARIGDGFHLPSVDQINELFNSEYTTNEWTTVNGVNGRRVTSLINGNSIFLPAAGYYNGTVLDNRNSISKYWTSRRIDVASANNLFSYSGYLNTNSIDSRHRGTSVRAVHN